MYGVVEPTWWDKNKEWFIPLITALLSAIIPVIILIIVNKKSK